MERLKHEGTSHSSSDLLKICVKMGASWSAQVFRQADGRQRRSKSALSELHERAGSLAPPPALPVAFDQSYGSTDYNVQQNVRKI